MTQLIAYLVKVKHYSKQRCLKQCYRFCQKFASKYGVGARLQCSRNITRKVDKALKQATVVQV